MNRLFKVRPGFDKQNLISNSKRMKKNNQMSTNYPMSSQNRELMNLRIVPNTTSSKMLKLNLTKYNISREGRSLQTYKTLDESSVDLRNENVRSVLNNIPTMKRSKTPITYHKPSHNISHYNGEPKSYYGNNKNNQWVFFKDEKLDPENESKFLESQQIEAKNYSVASMHEKYSKVIENRAKSFASKIYLIHIYRFWHEWHVEFLKIL
jgi:hypothetical protein